MMEAELERQFGSFLRSHATLDYEQILKQTRRIYRELVEAIQRKEIDGEEALGLEVIHKTLYGCCGLLTVGGREKLEEVLGALGLVPSLWVRIVEIAVRSGGLQGDQVLKLRECEEAVLERIAWAEGGGGAEAVNSCTVPRALFIRKLHHLASTRIAKLSTTLGLSHQLQQRIWTCFELCFNKHLSLLYGRHLDHILLSSIYVACLLSHRPKPFLEILRIYRENGGTSAVYRNVLLSLPDRYGDLIQFYNSVYLTEMKEDLYERGLPPRGTPLPPPPSPLSSPLRHVLVRLRCPENFPSPSPSPLPPYVFSSSPKSNLIKINEMVAASVPSCDLNLSTSIRPSSTFSSRLSSILKDRLASRRHSNLKESQI